MTSPECLPVEKRRIKAAFPAEFRRSVASAFIRHERIACDISLQARGFIPFPLSLNDATQLQTPLRGPKLVFAA